MLRLLTASLVLAAVSVGVLGNCVFPEFMEFDGKCYAVYNGPDFGVDNGQSYANAADFCKTNKSGELAAVTSQNIQMFLTGMLRAVQSSPGAWIGLNDITTEGTYTWESGDPFDESLTNWAKGYPEEMLDDQDCVRMMLDFQNPGLWNDASCDKRSAFICQHDAVSPVQPLPKCRIGGHDDYTAYYAFCFKVLTTPLTYADAKLACTLPGYTSSVATVIAGFHSSFIHSLMSIEGVSSAWIGLQTKGGKTFKWNDGSPFVFADWGPNEPSVNATSRTDGCVSAEIDSDSNSDWMSFDCNEKKPAVCSIISEPIPVPPLNPRGECPDDFIDEEEFWCYHHEATPMNWTDAQEKCKSVYSDSYVAIPHSVLQNRYIADSFSNSIDSLWLGISRDDEERKFQAVDGNPIDFVFWEEGQPSGMADDENCISLNQDETWTGRDCSEEKEFVCTLKKINTPIDHGACRNGWFMFGNKCFKYFDDRATFGEAATNCRNAAIGGNLAAVDSNNLQYLLAFLMNHLGSSDTPSDVWIGLWDIAEEGNFKWLNEESFGFFKNWAPGQPDGYLQFDNVLGADDCVKMVANPSMPGQWDDVDCDIKLPYLCECYLDPDLTPQPIDPGPSICVIPEYVLIPNTCMHLEPELLTFEEAEQKCNGKGGHLATAPDGYVEGFLQFFVTTNASVTSAWIGLRDEVGDGEYSWTYPSVPVTYANWGADSPKRGQCVAVTTSSDWLNPPCDEERSSICEVKLSAPTTPGPSLWHCEEGWIEYEGNCYNFDTYGGGTLFYTSYAQARQACSKVGATLASIHSAKDNLWLYTQARFLLGKRKVWLGMHRSPEPSNRMVWNDGSTVNYVNWADDEPNGALDGSDCITMYAGDKGLGQWSDTNCFELNAYACQKKAMKGNPPICEPEWEQVLMKSVACLYFSRPEDGHLSWDEAEAFCNNKGAHLASILAATEENIYSYYLPEYFGSSLESWPWLGYRKHPGTEYMWSDGFHSVYSNWGSGQPDGKDDDCTVHEVRGLNGWYNINCGLHRPFVCKKNSTSSEPIIKPPTMMPPDNMGCSDGTRIGNVCYKLVQEPMSWEDARQTCAAEKNGDLASIPLYAVQVLVTTLLTLVEQKNIWIGMSSKMPGSNYLREFHWIDGNTLTFTNWASGQPNLPLDEDHCVKMLNDPDIPGQWYDDLCDQMYPFICQYDLTVGGVKPPPDVGIECPAGFEGLKPSCFKIDTIPRSYSSAISFCESHDTILAPVENGYEDAFIELLMFSNDVASAWIGLRSNEETSGSYKWSADNWPLTYTNWGDQEPSSEKGCVASVFSEGWQSVDCFNPVRATVCRSKEDIPPSTAPVDPNLRCPVKWYPLGNQCYLVDTGFESDNVLNAFFKCSSLGGLPPSIHSRAENLYIRNTVLSELTGRYVWLGLVLSEGKYKWMDESPVEYTNWKEGEDTSLDDGKECVAMVAELDGKWERRACTEESQVICKQPPGLQTTTPEPTDVWMVTYQAQSGIGVGPLVGIIVGGATALVVFLVVACYCCDKKKNEDWDNDDPEGPRSVRLNTDVELRIKGTEEKGEGSGSHKSDSDSQSEDGVAL